MESDLESLWDSGTDFDRVLIDVPIGLPDDEGTLEKREELDEKIAKTDDLIDEIVYELYGLTDEEIAIVEEAVGE